MAMHLHHHEVTVFPVVTAPFFCCYLCTKTIAYVDKLDRNDNVPTCIREVPGSNLDLGKGYNLT
jgi:hypothetical protein